MNRSIRLKWTRLQLLLCGLLVLTALAYATRLHTGLQFPDEIEYHKIATNLRLEHLYSIDGVNPTALRPPGYPYFLAAVSLVTPNMRFAKICNLVFWLISALLTAGLTRKLFGQVAAALSLCFILVYVVELYSAGTLYPQATSTTLFLLSLWLHFVWHRSGQWVEIALQAVLWAALILITPLFLCNLLVFLVYLLWERRVWLPVLCIGAFTLLACVGWSARNQRVMGSFTLGDNSGLMLILGNSDETGPNTGPTLDLERMLPAINADTDEMRRDNSYKGEAKSWIKSHPRRAAMLYVEKFANWFNCQTNLKTKGSDSGSYGFVIGVVYFPLLLAALLSPFLWPSLRRLELVFAAHYFIAALAYAVFFTRIRYRLPYDYLVIILAAGVVSRLILRVRRSSALESQ